jgi:hypothetical protein
VVTALSGAMILGLGLSAALWLPALEILSHSARRGLPHAIRTYWSVHPLGMLETLFPGLWSGLPLSPEMSARLFESREPFLQSLYIGGPALGLVAACLADPSQKMRRALGTILGASCLIALGRHFFFYDLATAVVFPLRILRYPVKSMIMVAFSWATLGGMGFDTWRRVGGQALRRWFAVVCAPLLLVLLLGLTAASVALWASEAVGPDLLLKPPPGYSYAQGLRPLAERLGVGSALVAIALGLALARGREGAPTKAFALAALSLGDLVFYHRHPSPLAPKALVTYRPEVLGSFKDSADPRLYVFDYSDRDSSIRHLGAPGPTLKESPRDWDLEAADALGKQMSLTPATAGRWGLRTGFDIDYRGLHSAPMVELTDLLRMSEGTPAYLRLLRLGAVTHLVALHEDGFEGLALKATLPGLFVQPIRVFRVPRPLPRCYAVEGTRIADGVAALETLLDPGFDIERVVLLPEGLPRPASPGFEATARIVTETPDHVHLETELNEPGYVVLVDAFDEGWEATLDGRRATVLRANLAFRAVAVPGGRHAIDYAYKPMSLRLGAGASGVSLCLGLGLAWAGKKGPE